MDSLSSSSSSGDDTAGGELDNHVVHVEEANDLIFDKAALQQQGFELLLSSLAPSAKCSREQSLELYDSFQALDRSFSLQNLEGLDVHCHQLQHHHHQQRTVY